MESAWPNLNLTVTNLGDSHLVSLRGELDADSADRVTASLIEIAGSELVLNLGGLSFIDAAGVSALMQAKVAIEVRGHAMTLTNAHGIVRRVFELTDLAGLLTD